MIDESQQLIIDKLSEFERLHSELQHKLDDAREKAAERLIPILDKAFDNLNIKIESFIAEPEVTELILEQEESIKTDENFIKGLIEDGLYSQEEGDIALEELSRHEDYTLLRKINTFRASGLLSSEAEVEEVAISYDQVTPDEVTEAESTSLSTEDVETDSDQPQEIDSSKEAIEESRPAKITFYTNPNGTVEVIKVGASSRALRYRLSKKTQEGQHDYSVHRLIALKAIIEGGGEIVRSRKISDLIANDKRTKNDTTKSDLTSRAIKTWLEKIVFYGDNLILPTGQRGAGAGYYVNPKFNAFIVNEQLPPQPVERKTTTETAKKNKSGNLTEDQFIAEVKKGTIPLRESNVLMTYLYNNKDLLELLGIPTPNEQLVEAINEASIDEDQHIGANRRPNSDIIDQERLNVVKKFIAAFTDDEVLGIFLDNMTADSVLEPMADYLTELDDSAWSMLVNQVLRARITTTVIEKTNGNQGSLVDERITIITLPNGRQFKRIVGVEDLNYRFIEVLPEKHSWGQDEEIDIQSGKPQFPIDAEQELSESVPNAVPVPDSTEVNAITPKPRKIPSKAKAAAQKTPERKEPEWAPELRKEIGGAIKTLETFNAVFEGRIRVAKLRDLTGNSKIGTDTSVKNLEKARLIDTKGSEPKDYDATFKEAVMMIIINKWGRKVFSSTKGTKREQALEIIDQAVDSYLRHIKEQSANK